MRGPQKPHKGPQYPGVGPEGPPIKGPETGL